MRSPLTGLVVLRSNGEAPNWKTTRPIQRSRWCSAMPPGRPLLAGTGRESTAATIAGTRRAAELGVDAVLVRTPAFFKSQMTSDVFVRHYSDVADRSPVPVFLYNVTSNGHQPAADAVATLSQHPNIAGIKESGNDMAQFAEYLGNLVRDSSCSPARPVPTISALALGADGAVLAVAGAAPEICVRIFSSSMRTGSQRRDRCSVDWCRWRNRWARPTAWRVSKPRWICWATQGARLDLLCSRLASGHRGDPRAAHRAQSPRGHSCCRVVNRRRQCPARPAGRGVACGGHRRGARGARGLVFGPFPAMYRGIAVAQSRGMTPVDQRGSASDRRDMHVRLCLARAVSFCPASGGARKLDSIACNSWSQVF